TERSGVRRPARPLPRCDDARGPVRADEEEHPGRHVLCRSRVCPCGRSGRERRQLLDPLARGIARAVSVGARSRARADRVTMPDSGPPLASVTIDVDTLGRDFFVDVMSNESRYALQRVTYDRVVPRILDWLDTIGTRATFFVVGVDAAACGDAVGEIARRGHEVANHTWSHPKHFAQLHEPEMADEIRRAHDVIARTTGIAPVGLRTPGYTVTPSVVNVLQTIGYAYDASLVPSWSYSALKHAFRIFGGRRYRESLVVQNLASAWAPKRPFTTDSSHRAPGVAGV